MIWGNIHALCSVIGSAHVSYMLWQIIETGGLPRSYSAGGEYSTASVLFMLLVFATMAISGLRAAWIESERP